MQPFQHFYYNDIIKIFYQNNLVPITTTVTLNSTTLIADRILKCTPSIDSDVIIDKSNVVDMITPIVHMFTSECFDVQLNALLTLCCINSLLQNCQILLINKIVLRLGLIDYLLIYLQYAIRIQNDHYTYLLFELCNHYLKYNIMSGINKLRLDEYLLKFDVRKYDAYIFNSYMLIKQQL